MIISIDTETQGLDCTKFICGCIIKENNKKGKHFTNKKEMWEYILNLGRQLAKQRKVLNVYAHNHTYDFYTYADLKDKNIKYFCHRPFIASYKENNKEIIKFLDSWSIFKMPLQKLGTIIKHEKTETPQELLDAQEKGTLTPTQLKTIQKYCENDTIIVQKSIKYLKKLLKNNNINIKRIYTINQVAIQWFLTKLKKENKTLKEQIFWWENNNELRKTLRATEIHEAYRGARNECWKLGNTTKATYIDVNNLYGHASINMKFPNLKSERKKDKPLEKGQTIKQIIQKIGITRCIIKNNNNKLGLLPIRTTTGNYYPQENTILIGTWTNQELKLAEQEGYKILDIQWTVNYEEGQNPYKNITTELWNLRKNSQNEFEKHFYKQMMNSSYGKLAQTRINQEIFLETIDKCEEYLGRKYKIISTHGYDALYINQNTTQTITKKYYAPIIPTLINADARITMYQHYKKIPYKDLIYTDTDSIIYTGDHDHKFNITNELGAFKKEHQHENIHVYGKKTYKIGKEIKVGGITKKDITEENYTTGVINTKQMNTLKTEKEINKVGTFKNITRNLNDTTKTTKKIKELYEKEKIFIDHNLKNIAYFMKTLQKEIANI